MENLLQQIILTSIILIVFVILTLGVYYLASRRELKNKKKHFENLHLNLTKGQTVEFSNGLIGKITKVGEEYCDIQIKSGAVITVSRFAITRLVDL